MLVAAAGSQSPRARRLRERAIAAKSTSPSSKEAGEGEVFQQGVDVVVEEEVISARKRAEEHSAAKQRAEAETERLRARERAAKAVLVKAQLAQNASEVRAIERSEHEKWLHGMRDKHGAAVSASSAKVVAAAAEVEKAEIAVKTGAQAEVNAVAAAVANSAGVKPKSSVPTLARHPVDGNVGDVSAANEGSPLPTQQKASPMSASLDHISNIYQVQLARLQKTPTISEAKSMAASTHDGIVSPHLQSLEKAAQYYKSMLAKQHGVLARQREQLARGGGFDKVKVKVKQNQGGVDSNGEESK